MLKGSVNHDLLNGVLFVGLFSLAAFQIADIALLKHIGISPLLIGIVIGMFYAFTLRNHLPKSWVQGIFFSSKQLLRLGIIFYGFRLTFQQIADVGITGMLISTVILVTTMLIGIFAGKYLFKMDRDTSILVASGAAICGAAAVLATETVLNSKPYKSAIAVATVVLFGTIAMFLYPALHAVKAITLNSHWYGLFVGSTIHEVAQVVAAASAVPGAEDTAIVVKMTRVMMLAPMLVVLGLVVNKSSGKSSIKKIVPWFAIGFICVVAFNSFDLLAVEVVDTINHIDTFLLTMAMTALGMETNAEKFRAAGVRPILLSSVLFVWLFITGYFLITWLS